jgi:hypothetical protein
MEEPPAAIPQPLPPLSQLQPPTHVTVDTKVVLRIARAKERRANTNVQFARAMAIDG